MATENAQCHIVLQKGAGASLVELKIIGFFNGSDENVHVHTFEPNQKYIDDLEPNTILEGYNYSLTELADFYVTSRSFTTADLTYDKDGTATTIDLTTKTSA